MSFNPVYLSKPGIVLPDSQLDNADVLARIREQYQGDEEAWGMIEASIQHVWGLCDTKTRYLDLDPNHRVADYAVRAARLALADTNITPAQLNMVIYGGVAREYFEPATAMEVAGKLGVEEVHAFDVTSACAGVLEGTQIAAANLAMRENYDYALICAGELTRNFLSFNIQRLEDLVHRVAGLTIGNAAAAWLVGKKPFPGGCLKLVEMENYSLPGHWGLCSAPIDGSFTSFSKELFRLNIHCAPRMKVILDRVGWDVSEVDHFVFHQPSKAVILKVLEALGANPEKAVYSHHLYANTVSTTVPVAMYQLLKERKPKPGDKFLLSTRRRRASPSSTPWGSGSRSKVMGKYANLYGILTRNFGTYLRPLATFGGIQTRFLLDGFARMADHLLFPGFRKLPIEKPVFIIGNPRSGTTFVHRFLLNTEQLCAFELWEMLFTGITARRVMKPMVGALAPFSPARYHSGEAHETSLRDVETDDAMAFFRFMDGGFLWAYFLAWEDQWGSELCKSYFEADHIPAERTERLFRYMEGCWRRNLYAKQRSRIIVKSSLFTLQVDELLRRYPDCKLVYLVRDPVETIPSGMSLISGVLENGYQMSQRTKPEKRAHYYENLYQASVRMFTAFEERLQRGGIPGKNLQVVAYPDLMRNLEGAMDKLVSFLELSPPAAFEDLVKKQAEKQRRHKSAHTYSLEKYGLTEERIRRDLAFLYEKYDLE